MSLGISRRRIAYYESESDHPPANLLADLARALKVSTDQLLSDARPAKRPAKAALGSRLERPAAQADRTAQPKSKQQLLNIIDTFIENEALKQRSSR